MAKKYCFANPYLVNACRQLFFSIKSQMLEFPPETTGTSMPSLCSISFLSSTSSIRLSLVGSACVMHLAFVPIPHIINSRAVSMHIFTERQYLFRQQPFAAVIGFNHDYYFMPCAKAAALPRYGPNGFSLRIHACAAYPTSSLTSVIMGVLSI
jgi:hypothetical protein